MFAYLKENLPHSGILRKMLLLLLGGIVLPVLLISALYMNLNLQDMQQQAVLSYESYNRQAAISLDSILEGVGRYTAYPYYSSFFNEVLTKDYSTPEGFRQVTGDYRAYQSAVNSQVMRYNSSIYGTILYNHTADISFLGGYAYPEELRQVVLESLEGLNEKEDYVNEILLLASAISGRAEKEHIVLLARPLFNTSTREYQGYFGLLVKLDVLAQLIRQDAAPDGVNHYIIGEGGLIIYSQDVQEIGARLCDTRLATLQDGQGRWRAQAGASAIQKLDGRNTYVTREVLGQAEWSVVSTIDAGVLLAGTRSRQATMLLLLVLLMVVALVLVSLVSVSVSRPIRQLHGSITDITQSHDFSTRVAQDGRGEVGELAANFNLLLEEIETLLHQVVQQEKEKQSAEMAALQAQVNPHFLGNTLNTIKWMANMQCADNIAEATDSLIALMNYALDTDRRYVTVDDELNFTRRYIDLMQLRYFGAFDLEYDIDEEVLGCQSLRFMLQPLVDNAIFHGFQNHAGRNLMRISAHRRGDVLEFHVWDNGVGMARPVIDEILQGQRKKERGFNSIGVYNVVERIRMHYGGGYGVEITSREGGPTDVMVVTPALPLPCAEGVVPMEEVE